MRSLSECSELGGRARRRRSPAARRAGCRRSARAAARRTVGPTPSGFWTLRRPCAAARLGTALAARCCVAAAAVGAMRGGQYQAFVAGAGRPRRFSRPQARLRRQSRDDLRRRATRRARSARPRRHFAEELDAVLRRRRGARQARKAPLVASASVRKLYPGRIVIDIVERIAGGALAARRRSQHRRRRRRRARRTAATRGSTICRSSSATAPTSGCGNIWRCSTRAEELQAPRSRRACSSASGAGTCDEDRASTSKLPGERPDAGGARRCCELERNSRILERDSSDPRLAHARARLRPASADAADARARKLAAKPKKGEKP